MATGDYEGADTVVFHNELAYHDSLPVQWLALPQAPDAYQAGNLDSANLLLLQAGIAMEEQPIRDKHEELTPLAAELARLDLKLNVVLTMLGSLVTQSATAPPVPVQFNALGASWQQQGALPSVGSRGLLRIRLRGALPQTLDLYAEIDDNEGGGMRASFINLAQPVAELIQQLCFLKHRQRIAGARKSRNM